MRNKRRRQRRSYAPARTYPLVDDAGCIVPFNRSRRADRRLNDLQVLETRSGLPGFLRRAWRR